MDKVHFLFGVHNHQPIGNFDFVFDKAYELSYLPFLEAMERHPAICAGTCIRRAFFVGMALENHHPAGTSTALLSRWKIPAVWRFLVRRLL